MYLFQIAVGRRMASIAGHVTNEEPLYRREVTPSFRLDDAADRGFANTVDVSEASSFGRVASFRRQRYSGGGGVWAFGMTDF
ncbi:hypothetical protein PPGU16_57150 (plasmid) [Paraburkholderia largidicola]|uniref:Uncharacterized protein n=1 Tax=Paraburkholderia largidicola TaxID=3014751 RepID=A0A7I8BWK1_9BURK|nr:hypothetical protein PPGU16_57150 [Paraburkholderia sp. PGU16]